MNYIFHSRHVHGDWRRWRRHHCQSVVHFFLFLFTNTTLLTTTFITRSHLYRNEMRQVRSQTSVSSQWPFQPSIRRHYRASLLRGPSRKMMWVAVENNNTELSTTCGVIPWTKIPLLRVLSLTGKQPNPPHVRRFFLRTCRTPSSQPLFVPCCG